MKLGILLDRYDPDGGGAEVHTDRLVRRALAAGDAVWVAVLQGEAPAPAATLAIDAPRRRPTRDRVFAEAGIQRLRAAGAEVVLAFRHAPGCDVYLPHGGLIADALAAKDAARGGSRWWRTLGRVLSPRVRFFLEAERAVLGAQGGPAVIAVSRALAARIAEVYPSAAHRTVVVPNGVDARRFTPEGFEDAAAALREDLALDDAYVGLLLARQPRLKGLETALRAMARPEVGGLSPPFHLVFAGGPLPRDLARLARALGLAGRLHVAGGTEDPRPLFAAADVCLHPTWYDPCSLACLEALAMGVPVITTPANGVGELMGPRGGIVVEAVGAPDALAVAIRVLADPVVRAGTADDARWLVRRHREGLRLDQVLDVCRGVAEGGRG